MAYELRPGQGSLFENTHKKSEKQPDKRGDALIECPHCKKTHTAEISGWTKQGRSGDFLSLSIKEKQDRGAQGQQSATPPARQPLPTRPPTKLAPPKDADLDSPMDDIPF